jgi:hypothetical protein
VDHNPPKPVQKFIALLPLANPIKDGMPQTIVFKFQESMNGAINSLGTSFQANVAPTQPMFQRSPIL